MIKVNVIVKNKTWFRFLKNPAIYLEKKIKKIQSDKFFGKKRYYFSLKLSNTNEIKFLNKKFRKKNKSTDILSFPNQTKKKLKTLLNSKQKIYLGDIIINSKELNILSKDLFKKHFDTLWVHGLVHLFGYDHKKNRNFKKMNAIEKRLLKKLN